MSESGITRRAMLVRGTQTTAAAAAAWSWTPLAAGVSSLPEPQEGVWDAHGHLSGPGLNGTPAQRMAQILESADRVGIARLVVFMGYPFVNDPTPEEIRHENDQVLQAIEHAQGRVFGFVYLNPKDTQGSLDELNRCVANGPMVGIKLWVAMHCHERELDPIVERAVELKAPVLQHTWDKATGNLPGESTPLDLAALAARHPEASFIAAHVGGEWESGIRAIRATPNVTAEVCGSDPTAGMVEMAVRELGAERVLYGSDYALRSFASQLAKVHGAEIPEAAKRLILGGNLRRLLKPILAAKGMTS